MRLNIQVKWTATCLSALRTQSPQTFPPKHMENRKTQITLIDVQSNHHRIASPLRNKEAFIDCMLGLRGRRGLLFDASKQYTCLQCPWSPFAKYISHIPTAPFNTEKCKERPALPVLSATGGGGGGGGQTHNDPLRTTWDLVVVVGGGGDKAWHCLGSIGGRGSIGPTQAPPRRRVACGDRK